MISHGLPGEIVGKSGIAHDEYSFYFSNNFSTLPNDKIVGRSKLEAFAEKF